MSTVTDLSFGTLQQDDMLALQRILIVDDEPRYRQAYRELLAGGDRCIEECGNGTDALARLAQRDIDVVILDLKLPDIGGIAIMNWLTEQQIPTSVIVFSADESIDSAIHALRRGAFEFIRKQSDPDDLILSVERALQHRREEQAHQQMATLLADSERLHRFLVEQSPDLIYTLDRNGHFVFINSRVKSLLGYEREELIGRHFSTIVHEDDLDHAYYAFNERRVGERATTNFEVRLKNKQNGTLHFDNTMVVAILSSQGMYDAEQGVSPAYFRGASGVARDITERKLAEETIAYQALHDQLTGLPNRRLFLDRLELAIIQCTRRSQKLAVMYLDMDRFKLINDSYGHPIGDQLLKEFAQRIRHCLRSGDTLARQGGDEFSILLPDLNERADATTIAHKILAELKAPFTVAERDYLATVSIGIALYPDDGESPDTLIKHADIAMYKAKARGKNGYLEFDDSMKNIHIERISLENDLRQAIADGDQFELHFQPQVCLAERRVTGFEALIRWNHPTRGRISPDAFIPLAEETGLIVGISDWVLAAGCAQMAALRRLGHRNLKLGINLSAPEFERSDLLDRIAAPIERHGIPPESIEVEITESLLVNDAESVISKVRQLRHSGLRVSIDDFGTRYSSLNYLRRFDVNAIKIDQSFIGDLGNGGRGSEAIIHAILAIARSFGMHVIAEGIETPAQRQALSDMGCSAMQGYLFSRPLPAGQLEEFLKAGIDDLAVQAGGYNFPS